MQGLAPWARALSSAAALAIAGTMASSAVAQQQAGANAQPAGGAAQAQPAAAAPAASFTPPRGDGYAELEQLPDFTGVWTLGAAGGSRALPTPKLTPPAQARLDAFRAKQQAEGVDQSRQVQCLPPGMPAIMRQPYPLEFLFTPGRVTILTETYTQVRRIYTDGRPMPEDPDFFFNGTSVGRWEGDALLVDTAGFSPLTEISAGIPHSEQMRIHERMWLAAPDVLNVETTITDPEVLAEPLVTLTSYRKQPTWEIREYVCEENNRLVDDPSGANVDLGLDDEGDPFGPPVD
jgi:hypothetical protein